MTAVSPILRSLAAYALSLPLAVVLGYALATPLDLSNLGIFTVIAFILALPLLLRWHQPLLLLAWNSTAIAIIIPGHPDLWLLMAPLSLTITLARRTLNRSTDLVSLPALNWPLVILAVVCLVTAQATGGIRLRSMGSEELVGGKRYLWILAAILGYFAISFTRIPKPSGRLYVSLYFLGGLTAVIGSLPIIFGSSVNFMLYLFPVDVANAIGNTADSSRWSGAAMASQFMASLMLARFGLRGVFLSGKPLRTATFLLIFGVGLYGGYRSVIIAFLILFGIMFYLEDLLRSRLLPTAVLGVSTLAVLIVIFAPHLPLQMQRCVAFLPLEVDPMVRLDAEASTTWRLEMWKSVLPQVPKHLLLGTGFAIERTDLEIFAIKSRTSNTPEYYGSAIASDFHNGPLSVLLPLGIWGLLGFVWLCWAGLRVLHANYRYSDPELKTINMFLFALFLTQTILFFFIYGSFQTQLAQFTGLLGLSVALNGGVLRHAPVEDVAPTAPSPLVPMLPKTQPSLGRG